MVSSKCLIKTRKRGDEMNTAELKAEIARNGITARELAHELNVTEQTFSAKANSKNGSEFTQSEIAYLKKRLKLSDEQVSIVFFTYQVS